MLVFALKRKSCIELISLGSVNASIVNPSEVFQLAVHKLAVKVLFVHNHPSGNLTPSAEDKDLTDHLIQAGRIITKEVLDHLIISTTDYFSFENDGLMAKLRKSKKYAVRYLEEGRLIKQGKIETAKNLKDDGLALDRIAKATGLTLREIKKL